MDTCCDGVEGCGGGWLLGSFIGNDLIPDKSNPQTLSL
ncbi:hypothetical protein D777_00594 [Marinobacter nitratireducens]|uniref:Uncharacterized protein n=1 Tax=Marinobacter nitratireducens TaxID=1137280 RepID=A0A072NFS2_9GAMM|nr:hypothetical protein D777_00594 [Marinobacter nitratireducens]